MAHENVDAFSPFSFDFFGIYVVMFLEILKTLLQVLCVFFFLIVAFSLAFYMLLYNEVRFVSCCMA